MNEKGNQKQSGNDNKKSGPKQNFKCQPQQEQKKRDPEDIPVLKFGPNNNFMKVKEAISKAALKSTEIWVS